VSCTLRGGDPLPGVAGWPLDMRDLAGLNDLAAGIAPLDVVILNAGVIGPSDGPLGQIDPARFAEVMQVNALAPLAITRALLPKLRSGGRVLAISSQMAWMGYAKPDTIAYRMSKVALNKGMQALATELAPRGIAAVAIDPGWVRTDMGGPGADISTDQSVAGMMAVMDRFTLANSGSFLAYDGSPFPW
jgi:NAD(P)-dependent dehydrogenase (short-subunit alcohol dehydrogenase family)